jgi:hypothetical protein
MHARKLIVLLVLTLLATSVGCFLRGPGDVKREVQARTELDLNRQFGIRAGRFTLFLARTGLKIAGEADEIPLQGVRRVEVGVYEVRRPDVYLASARPKATLCQASFDDWDLVVRVCSPDEHVLMFTKTKDDSIRGVIVVVQDREDVVIVRARGKLERALEGVMQLIDEDGDGSIFDHRPRGRTVEDEPYPEPEPMVAVCDTSPDADPLGQVGCTDPEEARARVLDVARLLSPSDEVLPAL